MLKICFISFYDIKEYILSLKLAFEEHLYTVENYPLFRFAYDQNDKLENFQVHLVKFLQKIETDLVFWIFLDVDIDVFKLVRSSLPKATRLIMYLADPTPVNDVFLAKLRHFDYVVSHHLETVELISQHAAIDVERILYVPPCFDDLLFKPDQKVPDKYRTDLVYLNYGLDGDVESLVRQLVAFSRENGLSFRIWGSPQFRTDFSDHYQASYTYLEQPLINQGARLVVCDDPSQVAKIFGQRKVFAGVGERMSEYGSLYIGPHTGIDGDKLKRLIEEPERALRDLESVIEQITEATYQFLVGRIHQKVALDLFSIDFYQKFYPDQSWKDRGEAVQHYLEKGFLERTCPVPYQVPKNFDDIAYAKALSNSRAVYHDNRPYLYYHWRRHSNDLAFISDEQIDLSQIIVNSNTRPNISFRNMCQLFKVLIDLYQDNSTPEELLPELSRVVGESPTVDLNLCLRMFFQWKEQVSQLYLDK
jgi:hypothetical protein